MQLAIYIYIYTYIYTCILGSLTGEDRWLCTLLLQQGYRVTYCAAADALTYAPETFHEFYNQRRRWMPSTMANITDLLSSYKNTIRCNDNISYPYMMYQFILFFASVLGPGTVLMMIAGSYNSVLGTNLWHSNILAVEPIIFFVIVCFTTQPNTHVLVAQLMSAVYTVIMTVVLVGTIINAATESLTSPNVVFLITLTGFFVLAGILHPQEIMCLVPGILYFLIFPSAYLLLPLYSLCNLNVVSWGTREKAQIKTKEEKEREKKEEEERMKAKKDKKGLLNWLGLSSFLQDIKEFYNTMLGRKSSEEEDAVESLAKRLDDLEKNSPTNDPSENVKRNELREVLNKKRNNVAENIPKTKTKQPVKVIKNDEPKRDDLINPFWLEDTRVGTGDVDKLTGTETAFWRMLIRIHLHPILKDKKKELEMEKALKSLRSNIVFGFLMLNFLWAVMIFQMQLLKETLEDQFFIPIPRADNPDEKMLFEPMGFAFLAVFGVVLLLQFIGTMLHRWDTFCHIIARTEIHASENTVEGKLRAADKLQSVGQDADDEFDIPPPDYDDVVEPEVDYPSDDDIKSNTSSNTADDSAYGPDNVSQKQHSRDHNRYPPNRLQHGLSSMERGSLPSIHDPSYRRSNISGRSPYPARVQDRYRPSYPPIQDYGGNRRPPFQRQFSTDLPPPTGHRYARQHRRLGQVRVTGQSLHRNFQRRYNHIIKHMGDDPPTRMNEHHGHHGKGNTTAVNMEPRMRHRRPNFDDVYRTIRHKPSVMGLAPNDARFPPNAHPHGGYNIRSEV